MRKTILTSALLATGLALPVIGQTVLRMPEKKQSGPEAGTEKVVSASSGFMNDPTLSIADRNAISAYVKKHGTLPEFGRPVKSPDAPEDETLYKYTGFNIAAGIRDDQQVPGWVNFNLEPFACDTVSSSAGASQMSYVKGNDLHAIQFVRNGNEFTSLQETVYDANTLEFKDIKTYDMPKSIQSYVPAYMVYMPETNEVYAVSFGYDPEYGAGEHYFLNILDRENGRLRRLSHLGTYNTDFSNSPESLTIKGLTTSFGVLYAYVSKGNEQYLARIDLKTASLVYVGKLPFTEVYGPQPMVGDPGGSLILNHFDLYTGTTYYKVNTWAMDGEVAVTKIEDAPTGYTWFYQRPETLNPPLSYSLNMADITDLDVTTVSDNEIKLSFTVPTEYADGTAIDTDRFPNWAGKNISVYAYIDNIYITLSGLPSAITFGDKIEATYDLSSGFETIPQGIHTLKVQLNPMYNEIGPLEAFSTTMMGYDSPGVVGDPKLSVDGQTATVSWTTPTESRFADFGTTVDLDNVKYTVVRDFDGKIVADGISETMCSDTFEDDVLRSYSYTIWASVDGRKGQGRTTPKVSGGKYVNLPYENAFDAETSFDGWTVINANNDGSARTWSYNTYWGYLSTKFGTNDDWAFTPQFRVEKGKVYEMRFKMMGDGILNIGHGSAPEIAAQENLATYKEIVNQLDERLVYFQASADGAEYISFHDYSTGEGSWAIDDIRISEVSCAGMPSKVTDAEIVPAANGMESATISAVMPVTNNDGTNLAALTAFKVCLPDGTEVASAEATPGEKAEVNVECRHGWNLFKLVAVSEAGEGYPVAVRKFIGSDIAKAPVNLKAVWGTKDSEVKLTWDVVSEGVNGGYVDADNTTYNIYEYNPAQSNRSLIGNIAENNVDIDILDVDKLDQYAISVTAVTAEGESDFSNVGIVLGKPLDYPFKEGFAVQGITTSPWIVMPKGEGNHSWSVDPEVYNDKIKAQNGDGLQLVFNNYNAGKAEGLFIAPPVMFSGAQNPIATVWAHHTEGLGDDAYIQFVAQTDGSNDFEPVSEPLYLTGSNGWQQHVCDLSMLKGVKGRMAVLASSGCSRDRVFIDNWEMREATGNDLVITGISGTRYEKVGQTLHVNVTVANFGAKTADSFTVLFNVNDETVAEKEVSAPLASGKETTVTFDLPLTAGNNGVAQYYAELLYDGDDNEDNNVSAVQTVNVIQQDLPAPSNLQIGESHDMTWSAPVVPENREVVLDFEDVPAFTTDNIEGWTTVDRDGNLTTSFIQYYDNLWPYTNLPLAWMVWSVKEAGCPDAQIWQPYAGEKCLIAWGNYGADAEGRINTKADDDWFISPEIAGGSEISFQALGNDPSCELEVLVSTTGRDPESFTTAVATTGFSTQGVWKEVRATLPSDAKYVAIHVKNNGFGIMIDDVAYTLAEKPVLKGYNVYCGASLENYVEQTTWKALADGLYGVSALYDLGESAVCERKSTSDVKAIGADGIIVESGEGYIRILGADGRHVNVSSINGYNIYSGVGKEAMTLDVQPGVYVVKVADSTAKVMVR